MEEKNYIEINKNAYDILAHEYKEKYKNNEGAKYFYDLIKNTIINRKKEKHLNMLEIGPGIGSLLNIFEENEFRTIGVELSNEMSKIAKKNSPNSIIINDNILNINFLSEQFDFILAMAVIHNFPEEDLINLLNKIKSWLKKDGYFILDTTNNKITENGYFEKEDYNQKVIRYRRKWNEKDLSIFLEKNGFIIDEKIKYIDNSSLKEWLIYILKIN